MRTILKNCKWTSIEDRDAK